MTRAAIATFLTVLATPVLASPNCTEEPKGKWLSETAMKDKVAEHGYKFRVFKVTKGNCYEIYGHDKNGARVEVYFHPMTGAIVKEVKS